MRYAYFPGCSASSTGLAYTLSYQAVAQRVGIEMQEIPDWNCCGVTSAHRENEMLSDTLCARSLALSEEAFGDAPVLAPCAGCYMHLRNACDHAQADPGYHDNIQEIIDRPWKAATHVVNGIEPFLDPDVQQAIAAQVNTPMTGLKVACYYGCVLLRPQRPGIFDDDERPHTMEDIVRMSGASTVEWNFHNECCGASHHITAPAPARAMVRRILENAAANGANAIACACPLCELNLDMREAEVNAARAKEGLPPLDVSIYYFTEILGASFGEKPEDIGITKHFHPALSLIEAARVGQASPEDSATQQAPEAPKAKEAIA